MTISTMPSLWPMPAIMRWADRWGGDVQRAMAVAARLETGLVWVNRVFDLPFDVPLGGARASGMGRHQGIEGWRSSPRPAS
jgi:acyl-CoA reductase-like NAD-dependent aldehyde dehydrogenase